MVGNWRIEESDNFPDDLFPLYQEEISSVEMCEQFGRRLLKRPDLTSEKIVTIGYFLCALRRLPLPTKGVSVVVSLKWTNTEGYDLRSIHLSEDAFRFDNAGWETGDFGGDSFGQTILDMEFNWRNREYDAFDAYKWIISLCSYAESEGCTVETNNYSDGAPNWNDEATDVDWKRLPAIGY